MADSNVVRRRQTLPGSFVSSKAAEWTSVYPYPSVITGFQPVVHSLSRIHGVHHMQAVPQSSIPCDLPSEYGPFPQNSGLVPAPVDRRPFVPSLHANSGVPVTRCTSINSSHLTNPVHAANLTSNYTSVTPRLLTSNFTLVTPRLPAADLTSNYTLVTPRLPAANPTSNYTSVTPRLPAANPTFNYTSVTPILPAADLTSNFTLLNPRLAVPSISQPLTAIKIRLCMPEIPALAMPRLDLTPCSDSRTARSRVNSMPDPARSVEVELLHEIMLHQREKNKLENIHAESESLAEQTSLLKMEISMLGKENKDYSNHRDYLNEGAFSLVSGADKKLGENLFDASAIKKKCDGLRVKIHNEVDVSYGQQLGEIDAKLQERTKILQNLYAAKLLEDSMLAENMECVDQQREEMHKEYTKVATAEKDLQAMNEELQQRQCVLKEHQIRWTKAGATTTAELLDKYAEKGALWNKARAIRDDWADKITKVKTGLAELQRVSHYLARDYDLISSKRAEQSPKDRSFTRACTAGDRLGMMSQEQRQQEELTNLERQLGVCKEHLQVLSRGHMDGPPSEEESETETRQLEDINVDLKERCRCLRKLIKTRSTQGKRAAATRGGKRNLQSEA